MNLVSLVFESKLNSEMKKVLLGCVLTNLKLNPRELKEIKNLYRLKKLEEMRPWWFSVNSEKSRRFPVHPDLE